MKTFLFKALRKACYEWLLSNDLNHLLTHHQATLDEIFPQELLDLIDFEMPERTSSPKLHNTSAVELLTSSVAALELKEQPVSKQSNTTSIPLPTFIPVILPKATKASEVYITPETGVSYPKKGKHQINGALDNAELAMAQEVDEREVIAQDLEELKESRKYI